MRRTATREYCLLTLCGRRGQWTKCSKMYNIIFVPRQWRIMIQTMPGRGHGASGRAGSLGDARPRRPGGGGLRPTDGWEIFVYTFWIKKASFSPGRLNWEVCIPTSHWMFLRGAAPPEYFPFWICRRRACAARRSTKYPRASCKCARGHTRVLLRSPWENLGLADAKIIRNNLAMRSLWHVAVSEVDTVSTYTVTSLFNSLDTKSVTKQL